MSFARSSYSWPHWFYFVSVRWGFRCLFQALGGLHVEGLDNLPARGPLILAPNHRSLLDPWIMLAASPLTFRSLAGRDLFSVPVMGPFMRSMGAFPVTRGQSDPEGMAQLYRYLRQGTAVVIFPEGRCSPDDQMLPLQRGVAVTALRLQTPILPVAILGSNRVLPLGSFRPRRHRLTVRFGTPLPLPRRGPEAVPELLGALQASLDQLLQ